MLIMEYFMPISGNFYLTHRIHFVQKKYDLTAFQEVKRVSF